MKKLKYSGATIQDLRQYYISIVRPVCEYAVPVWAASLTQKQIQKIEIVEKTSGPHHVAIQIIHGSNRQPQTYHPTKTAIDNL